MSVIFLSLFSFPGDVFGFFSIVSFFGLSLVLGGLNIIVCGGGVCEIPAPPLCDLSYLNRWELLWKTLIKRRVVTVCAPGDFL